jgi:oxygen-independent coproporphyrinogen III oxidase
MPNLSFLKDPDSKAVFLHASLSLFLCPIGKRWSACGKPHLGSRICHNRQIPAILSQLRSRISESVTVLQKNRRNRKEKVGSRFACLLGMTATTLNSDQALLLRYNQQTPRYTSYPPANHFTPDWTTESAAELIRASNQVGARNMGFYFHIPFCPKRCLFCGCNTEIGRSGTFIRQYMETLPLELERVASLLDPSRPVTQIHFGGGTPNAVPLSYLATLLDSLRDHFKLADKSEVAIECDPNLLTPEKLEALAAMGFNRVSYGLQDFNTDVLAAVNRKFPRIHPRDLVNQSRQLGFKGINIDLIYGLPRQTTASFRDTIQQMLAADPDRISLFPYAHVPWMKGHQSELETFGFPTPEERLVMATESRATLEKAGYVPIGMDHFAKPDDELTHALRRGTLHRNFQGYCPGELSGQIYAVGASAISQLHEGYLQNARDTHDYLARIQKGELAIAHGYRMKPEDQPVRAAIGDLLCQGVTELKDILREHPVPAAWANSWWTASIERLAPFIADGLVECLGDRVLITSRGLPLARLIAAAFDPLNAQSGQTKRYSQAV